MKLFKDERENRRFEDFRKVMRFCVRENISPGELFGAIMRDIKIHCQCADDDDRGGCDTCGFADHWTKPVKCGLQESPDWYDIDALESGAEETMEDDYRIAKDEVARGFEEE